MYVSVIKNSKDKAANFKIGTKTHKVNWNNNNYYYLYFALFIFFPSLNIQQDYNVYICIVPVNGRTNFEKFIFSFNKIFNYKHNGKNGLNKLTKSRFIKKKRWKAHVNNNYIKY